MLSWLLSDAAGPIVGLAGVLLSLLGFPLAAWGIRLTYLQAKSAEQQAANAKTASDAAVQAVSAFQFKLDRYAAYRDLSEASFAMDATRRHVKNGHWGDASDSYEESRRALIRVHQSSVSLTPDLLTQTKEIADHMNAFCNRVDAARAGKGSYPEAGKVLAAIRRNYEVMTALKVLIEKGIS